jgi:hypothetical protein
MKVSGLLLTAVAAASFAAAPALADQVVVHETTTTHTETHHAGIAHMHRHKVCRSQWWHHRRVTRCTWR